MKNSTVKAKKQVTTSNKAQRVTASAGTKPNKAIKQRAAAPVQNRRVSEYQSVMNQINITVDFINKVRSMILGELQKLHPHNPFIKAVYDIQYSDDTDKYITLYNLCKSYSLDVESNGEYSLPNTVDSLGEHKVCLQVAALYTKSDHQIVNPKYTETTINSFFEQESYNMSLSRSGLMDSVATLRKDIGVIGSEIFSSYTALADKAKFSNGSSIGVKRHESSIYLKLKKGLLTSCEDVEMIWKEIILRLPGIASTLNIPKFNPDLEMFTVPKNAWTGRVILKMNACDVFLLKEHEYALTELYNSVTGLELYTNPQLHEDRVQAVGEDGMPLYASVDLKNGSQCITEKHLSMFVPSDILSQWREYTPRRFRHGDRVITLEHFSGMGNPITFPLESLFFFVVVYAHIWRKQFPRKKVTMTKAFIKKLGLSTFGDDILIKREYGHIAVEALTAVGLRVNTDKTFVGKSVVESCGKDTFFGHNVRPVFFRHMELSNVKDSFDNMRAMVSLSNICLDVSNNIHGCVTDEFYTIWQSCISRIRPAFRAFCNNEGTFALRYPSSHTANKPKIYVESSQRNPAFDNMSRGDIDLVLLGILEGDSLDKVSSDSRYVSGKSYLWLKDIEGFVTRAAGTLHDNVAIDVSYDENISYPHDVFNAESEIARLREEISRLSAILASGNGMQ